ncbi:hypothetical protein J2S43_003233 [Catenuloplanes nepalensis]|uniref:Uncharacterized protein n=1 Tax=Catenuloplanes nepalensis TaxID=587533 RepID=A0ABT9MUM2_9ACTN|nr:hypothetical protein [Catenuloplanes nepalensis]MDP9794721.1 hypothetical protein [Catenuloplanes nepalensis]
MVTVCPECGAEESRDVWDQVVGGRLAWGVSGRCPADPEHSAWESCGWDETPPDIRGELLERHGEHRLRVTPRPGWSRMRLLRALRGEDTPLAEVKDLASRVLAGEITGTEGEMDLLAHRIRPAGLDDAAERVS